MAQSLNLIEEHSRGSGRSGQVSRRLPCCPCLPAVAVVRLLQRNPGHEGTQEVHP